MRVRPSEGFVLSLAVLGATLFAGPSLHADPPPMPPAVPPQDGPAAPPALSSSRVVVDYDLAPDSPSPSAVELWLTRDRGRTWTRAPATQAGRSRIAFELTEDGLYGVYLVLRSATDASSAPPSGGTAPQRWFRIDRTAPRLEVLSCTADDQFALNRRIGIRWRARDDDLPPRPVSLHFRAAPDDPFELITGALAAESSCRWTVPEGLEGHLELKLSAVDRAGNRAEQIVKPGGPGMGLASTAGDRRSAEARPAGVGTLGNTAAGAVEPARRDDGPALSTPAGPGAASSAAVVRLRDGLFGEPPDDRPPPGAIPSPEARQRYEQGTWHRLRGEDRQAMARFVEALKLDPDLLDCRHDLACLLYLHGEQGTAEEELLVILQKDPTYRPALKTLATMQAAARKYQSAREHLEKLLLLDSTDAESWLYLGDVRMFTGDRGGAREAWIKAQSLKDAEVSARATRRLDVFAGRAARFP